MPAAKPSTYPVPAFRLSLHIRHPSASPADISRELQLEADECFAAGERRRSRRPAAPLSVHSESYWVATIDPERWLPTSTRFPGPVRWDHPLRAWRLAASALPEVRSLTTMLTLACGRLALTHREFLSRLRAEGGSLALRATVAPGALRALRIPPEVSHWLSELGMTLEIECLEG